MLEALDTCKCSTDFEGIHGYQFRRNILSIDDIMILSRCNKSKIFRKSSISLSMDKFLNTCRRML